MAFSQGFNPHPRVSYANAAATGTASEAEYVEIAVTVKLDPEKVRAALDAALPPGLDVIEVVEVRTPDLVVRLEASVYRITLPGVDVPVAEAAVRAFMAEEVVEVERLTKNGIRRFDARGPVVALVVTSAQSPAGSVGPADPADTPESDEPAGDAAGIAHPCAILELVVRHVTPSVRPDDVLAALRRVVDLVPPVPPSVVRLAQGPLVEGAENAAPQNAVSDPLIPDREEGAIGA